MLFPSLAARDLQHPAHRLADTFAGYLGNDRAGITMVRAFPPILGRRPTDCLVYSIPLLTDGAAHNSIAAA